MLVFLKNLQFLSVKVYFKIILQIYGLVSDDDTLDTLEYRLGLAESEFYAANLDEQLDALNKAKISQV